MFLPIGDDNRDRESAPVINYALILLNIFVFVFLQHLGADTAITFGYAAVPAEILTGQDIITGTQTVTDPSTGQLMTFPGLEPTGIPVILTLITSQFLHGGIAHLGGNMLYLWIFGDNLENDMGHGRFLIFYLLCGVLAGLSQVMITAYSGQNLLVPSLGASGAISGVLGGYILQHPGRRVRVWILLGVYSIPAIIVVGLWFVFQIMNSIGTLGGEETGGVAYAAHIGGFVAGFLLVKLFVKGKSASYR